MVDCVLDSTLLGQKFGVVGSILGWHLHVMHDEKKEKKEKKSDGDMDLGRIFVILFAQRCFPHALVKLYCPGIVHVPFG